MVRKLKKALKKLFLLLLLIPSILAVAFLCYEPGFVSGESMYPVLENNDLVLIKKTPFSKKSYKAGQILMFRRADTKDVLIKRLNGLPGQKINILEGKLTVNGTLVDEMETYPGLFLKDGDELILKDCYFLSGDNRMHSTDSRDFGCIVAKDIIGEAQVVIWPPKNFKVLK